MPSLQSIWKSALHEAYANNLNTNRLPARAHAWATAMLAKRGYGYPGRPDITSGYRSPQEQLRLRRRWERGDREGLVARPACQSWHTVGRAIDVQSGVAGFDEYGRLLRRTGARDGRSFGDPGHFDWPSDRKPPNICNYL